MEEILVRPEEELSVLVPGPDGEWTQLRVVFHTLTGLDEPIEPSTSCGFDHPGCSHRNLTAATRSLRCGSNRAAVCLQDDKAEGFINLSGFTIEPAKLCRRKQ